MADYYTQSMRALQLAGMSERTQECYTRAVRQLARFYGEQPAEISETGLGDYFLYRRNVTGWSAATLRIAHAGVKLFFRNVLRRDWHLLEYLDAKRERRLPCVLSREEVFRILAHVPTLHNFTFFSFVYAWGLRLSEALAVQVSDVDSQRMMIHVHRGKGAKDHFVALPRETLLLLRRYWATHRNPTFLFPALGRGQQLAPSASTPMVLDSVQGAFRRARFDAGIRKRHVTIHTLRHSYATHLLEAGVNPHVIQRYMGHSRLETTMMDFHLTQKGTEDAYRIIDSMMKGFDHGRDH